MSSEEGIRLSADLMKGMIDVIAAHDERAQQDQIVSVQYLVAVAGYLIGSYPGPDSEREELLEHLSALMKHVADDRVRTGAQQQSGQGERRGREVPSDDPAMGIWRPD